MPHRARMLLLAVMALPCPALAQSQEFILDPGPPPAAQPDAQPAGQAPEPAWVATVVPEPGTDAAFIAQVRVLLAEGEPRKAKGLLDDWIDEYDRTDNPYLAEAYLLRGDARLAMDREYRALYDYETVIRDFPDSEFFAVAVEREFGIGVRYLNGLRRRLLGMRLETGRPTGEELIIRVQERLPGSRLAEEAAITLADHYYNRRQLDLAGEMYAIFLANYPKSEHRQRATLRQIDCNVARFKGPRYDGSSLLQARLLLNRYRDNYPTSAARSGFADGLETWIDESAAQQMLETAQWYLKTGDEPSAQFTLRRLVRKHPESAASREAVRMMQARGWLETARAEAGR